MGKKCLNPKLQNRGREIGKQKITMNFTDGVLKELGLEASGSNPPFEVAIGVPAVVETKEELASVPAKHLVGA